MSRDEDADDAIHPEWSYFVDVSFSDDIVLSIPNEIAQLIHFAKVSCRHRSLVPATASSAKHTHRIRADLEEVSGVLEDLDVSSRCLNTNVTPKAPVLEFNDVWVTNRLLVKNFCEYFG